MRIGLAFVLIIVTTICSLTAVICPSVMTDIDVAGPANALAPSRQLTAIEAPTGEGQGQPHGQTSGSDMSGSTEASAQARTGASLAEETRMVDPTPPDAIFLYEDPTGSGEWHALPTRDDLVSGRPEPVTFENGTQHEIHGKLFERIVGPENTTYLQDVGIPNMTYSITFDGEHVPLTDGRTGDATTRIAPFGEHGNGTFQFILDVNKPAGEYELQLDFKGFPATFPYIYPPLIYKAVVYVNHPTVVEMEVSPAVQVVGQAIQFSGALTDDSGMPVPSVPLQLWFDDVLLGPASDGVYIDDVKVQGADLQDDFEAEGMGGWSTYTAPGRGVGDLWEHGSPGTGHGPGWAHSGSRLWGTVLDGDYTRGAWSFLVTPRLNFTGNRAYTLSFWAWWSVYWNEDYAYVLASMDGGATWDEAGAMKFMGTNLVSGDWTLLEYNVTRYGGSDDVRFAFVFYSVDKTLDVRTDGTFGYRHLLPMETEADSHDVRITYNGDLVHRFSTMKKTIIVKRITHFEFEANASLKVGHRNQALILTAKLVDNTGAVLDTYIQGTSHSYEVAIYWNWDGVRRIDDLDREPVGPLSTMDKRSGNVSALYRVAWNQTLGHCSVTFKFGGADFYTNATGTDVYFVKASTYVRLLNEEPFHCHRGQPLVIDCELRLVPDQSIEDRTLGDPVQGADIDIFWGAERIGSRRTWFDGSADCDVLVPATKALGDVLVRFEYVGEPPYDSCKLYTNCTVVSETFIKLEGQQVCKGNYAWINGTLEDDQGQPLQGQPVYIIWKRLPEMAYVNTDQEGSFAVPYYIELESYVGDVNVTATFKGTSVYLAGETKVTYTVRVGTILERKDLVAHQGGSSSFQVGGALFEELGGSKGRPVEQGRVILFIDGVWISRGLTSPGGTVGFEIPDSPAYHMLGGGVIELRFEADQFYGGSRNVSFVHAKINTTVAFDDIRLNGEPFDPRTGTVQLGNELHARVTLRDETHRPIQDGNVSVFYRSPEGQASKKRFVKYSGTDANGELTVDWTFMVSTPGMMHFIAEFDGSSASASGAYVVQSALPSSAEFVFIYIKPSIPLSKGVIDVFGDRTVRVGQTLDLTLRVRDPDEWNMTGLTFIIVPPPEDMVAYPNGTLRWTTETHDAGGWTIRVYVTDGENESYTSFDVTVTGGPVWHKIEPYICPSLLVLVAISIVILVRKAWKDMKGST